MRVEHQPGKSAFIAYDDDGAYMGEIAYRNEDGRLLATHTGVLEACRGQGVAGELLDALVRYAEQSGMKIIPLCSYVNDAFSRFPQRYQGVTAVL